MAVRNRTIIRNEQSFNAGDAAITDNLPVNPLSFVDITLRMLNTTLNTLATLANMLTVLTRIEVLFRGSSIISIDPRDLWALQNILRWAWTAPQPRGIAANAVLRVMLRVSFSRVPFWMSEGFPATRAGELQIRYTPAAAFTNVTGASLHVETEEILDAKFTRFLKYTTLSRTPAATGESDQDLPIGNKYAGVLLFANTVPTAIAITSSMREVRLLIDNQEAFIPRTRWDSLHQNMMAKVHIGSWLLEHIHLENTATAYTQNADTSGPRWDVHSFANYGFLDFDPLKTDDFLLATLGRSRVILRINADVADAQRIMPLELLEIAGAQPAGVPA